MTDKAMVTDSTRTHATVTGTHANFANFWQETETDVTVWDTGNSKRHEHEVEFTLRWGQKGEREFSVHGHDDVLALARVLAHALGTTLVDDEEEEL